MINTGGSWQWFSVRRAWSWQQAVASQCPENVGSCYSLVNFTFRSPRDCWHLVTCLPLLHGESSDCLAETSKEFVQIFLSPSLCWALLVSCSCLSLPWRLFSRSRPAHRVLLQCPTAQHSTTEGVSSELGDRNSPRCWTLARAHSTWATPLPPLRLCNMTSLRCFLHSQVPPPPSVRGKMVTGWGSRCSSQQRGEQAGGQVTVWYQMSTLRDVASHTGWCKHYNVLGPQTGLTGCKIFWPRLDDKSM